MHFTRTQVLGGGGKGGIEDQAPLSGCSLKYFRAGIPARDGGRRAHLRLLASEPETVRQGGARHHRRRGQAVAVGERDPISGHMTTGHEWNGIKELNTPVPRAIWLFLIATVIFSIGYWLLMPAWPLGKTYTRGLLRSEEHTSELQSLMRISYAVFCLKKK